MAEPAFEISKEGIKLSYSRFLADTASGLAFILLGVAAYYLPLLGKSLQDYLASGNMTLKMGSEVKVLAAVSLFFLATPIGLLVNATGWFLLGPLQIMLEKLFYRLGLPSHVFAELSVDRWRRTFKLTAGRLHEIASLVDGVFQESFPELVGQPDAHIRGVYRFARSLGLLSLIGAILRSVIHRQLNLSLVLLVCCFLFLLLAALGALYGALFKLQQLYVLMTKYSLMPTDTADPVASLLTQLMRLRYERSQQPPIHET
jgi:hypothetical protein